MNSPSWKLDASLGFIDIIASVGEISWLCSRSRALMDEMRCYGFPEESGRRC
jgi:hypothetical protein